MAKAATYKVYNGTTWEELTFPPSAHTHDLATGSVPGFVKLGDDTVQTTAINKVSETLSRTYAVQVNSNGKLVVNVPWTNYYLRQYYTLTTSNAEYPILHSYTTATGTSSYKTTYGAVKSGFTFNPSTNTLSIPSIKLSGIKAPTTSGGSTYGVGGSGQVLMSNGSNVYWGDLP